MFNCGICSPAPLGPSVAFLPALHPFLSSSPELSTWQMSPGLPTPEAFALEERVGSHPRITMSWQPDSGGKGIGEKIAATMSNLIS